MCSLAHLPETRPLQRDNGGGKQVRGKKSLQRFKPALDVFSIHMLILILTH